MRKTEEEILREWKDERKHKPPFETWVLCYCRIYGFYIGCYQQILDTGWGNWNDGKELGVLPPTHWQPLPSPPNSTPAT